MLRSAQSKYAVSISQEADFHEGRDRPLPEESELMIANLKPSLSPALIGEGSLDEPL